MFEGWISLHRKIKENWIWNLNEPFDKRSAWIDLLLRANHKATTINFNNTSINLDVGEMVTSTERLAKEWRWSRHKVADFLKRLEKERYVGTHKGQ